MLTPPHLLALVHAVQQPIRHPAFIQLDVQHPPGQASDSKLQSEDMSAPTSDVALAALSGWRTLKALDAYLIGNRARVRDWELESGSLQQGVRCKPVSRRNSPCYLEKLGSELRRGHEM
jgi:hypothetical protein